MNIGAAAAQNEHAADCLDATIPTAMAPLAGRPAHLGMLTVTSFFESKLPEIVTSVRERTGVQTLIGCTAEGVIGPAAEFERTPAMALWLAHLPDVRVRGFHIHPSDVETVDSADEFKRLMRVRPEETPHFLLLADPQFTPHVVGILDGMARVYPQRPVFGGMSSRIGASDRSLLILDDDCFDEGAVAIALCGNLDISPVVSQGCRPVGKPFVITAAENNAIKKLGGRPALTVLTEVYGAATPQERKLMNQGLFIGCAITEYKDTFDRGDFLIRNVVHIDKEQETIYITDLARVGTTVQFQVRDARSAADDLQSLLQKERGRPAGAMLFSCNGRGTRMFAEPNHDVRTVEQALGGLPIAGLFCAGEIGPIGGRTFVHGHTASLALFRPAGNAGNQTS